MGVDVGAPQSSKGIVLLLGVLALVIVAIFTTGIGPVILGAVIIAIAAYLLYVVGGRINDWLRHGKPILRGRARKKQQQRQSGGGEG